MIAVLPSRFTIGRRAISLCSVITLAFALLPASAARNSTGLFHIHIERIAVRVAAAFDIHRAQQIDEVEAPIMMPAGFRPIHLTERTDAIHTDLGQCICKTKQSG